MRYLKVVLLLILQSVVPFSVLHPQEPLPAHTRSIDTNFTYDGFLETIDAIEDGRLENHTTPEEFEKLKDWVVTIAREGIDAEEQFTLEKDIQELLDSGEGFELACAHAHDYVYVDDHGQIITCSWASKRWRHLKGFVKKHKKALIIGAVAIAATAAVIGYLAAAPAVAAAAGSATSLKSEKPRDPTYQHAQATAPSPSHSPNASESSSLKQILEEQKTAFKESVHQENFLPNSSYSIWGDLGREMDATLARHNYHSLVNKITNDPKLLHDMPSLNANHTWNNVPVGIDLEKIHTIPIMHCKHGMCYQNLPEYGFAAALYQASGEVAASHGMHADAVRNFTKAIDKSPTNHQLYLERGKAHFDAGNYSESIQDFHQFTARNSPMGSAALPTMTYYFTRGLLRGAAHSGSQLCVLVIDLVNHPIHTTGQMLEGLRALAQLSINAEWDGLAQALVPEARELITNWNTLSDERKSDMAGFILGKHGVDILLPGATAKAVTKGVRGAREFAVACRQLRTAEHTLALEAAAGRAQAGVNVAEILKTNKNTLNLGESLGFSTQEMAGLKQAGSLEATIAEADAAVFNSEAFLASKIHFEKAQEFLKQFKGYMTESEAHILIRQTGTPTFPRPAGIPENYRVKLSDKGAGIRYVHPTDEQISIRVMPGKPHSHNPAQRNPYIIDSRADFCYDKLGNKVSFRDVSAHIPLAEYIYRK